MTDRMKAYEVIINSTCSTRILVNARSVREARRKAEFEANDHMLFSGPAVKGDPYHTYEPVEKWTVKEIEE